MRKKGRWEGGGGGGGWVNPATCLANRAYVVRPPEPRILELDDVLQLYGRFGIRFYCYRIKRPPERPLNIDGPARTIRRVGEGGRGGKGEKGGLPQSAFYGGAASVGVDHVREIPGTTRTHAHTHTLSDVYRSRIFFVCFSPSCFFSPLSFHFPFSQPATTDVPPFRINGPRAREAARPGCDRKAEI